MSLKIKKILKILFILILLTFICINYNRLKNIDIRALIGSTNSIITALLMILAIYFIKGITLVIPASLIYISVGMSLNTKTAIIVNCIGIFIEISVSYILGLILGNDKVTHIVNSNKYCNKLFKLQEKYKRSSTLIIRALPIFPIDICSLLWGSIKMNYPIYVIFSLIGILPRVVLFTILGNEIYKYIPMKYIILVAIVLISSAGISLVIKSQIKERNNDIHE